VRSSVDSLSCRPTATTTPPLSFHPPTPRAINQARHRLRIQILTNHILSYFFRSISPQFHNHASPTNADDVAAAVYAFSSLTSLLFFIYHFRPILFPRASDFFLPFPCLGSHLPYRRQQHLFHFTPRRFWAFPAKEWNGRRTLCS